MKLIREPLLHFLFAGALLFGTYSWMSTGVSSSTQAEPVRVGLGEVRWLRETFVNQWQRGPTNQEMNGLVTTLIEEELLAREARSLGLDQNDTIVRRRLAQKLIFLVEDTSRFADPGEDELRRFHAAHADRYRTEPQVSLRHIFFSFERRSDADADARSALTRVSTPGGRDGTVPEGDPLLLEDAYAGLDLQAVSSLFGSDFARAVFALTPGSWSGPIRSAFGAHLVLVTQLRQAEARPFEEVRDTVAADWRRQRERETKDAYLAKLRDKYGVEIDGAAVPNPDGGSQKRAAR